MVFDAETMEQLKKDSYKKGVTNVGCFHVKPAGAPDEEATLTEFYKHIITKKWDEAIADESIEVIGLLFGNFQRLAYVIIDVEEPELFYAECAARFANRLNQPEISLAEYMETPDAKRHRKPDDWMVPQTMEQIQAKHKKIEEKNEEE